MIVPREDAALIFRLMWGLQFYVKQHEGMLPAVTTRDEYASLPSKDKLPVRAALWEKRDLIDAYVRENPDRLSADELGIIEMWKVALVGEFYIHTFLKSHTIFLGQSHVYAVLGLYDPLEYMYSGRPLPIMVKTVLLPFKGRIVYDGMCETYAISFGPGIRRSFQEMYMAAKRKGQIIASLDTQAPPPLPVRRVPKLSEDCRTAAVEMAAASTRLRGHDALTKNVFELAQASARLAEALSQDPTNRDEQWQLLEQIGKALKRAYKALERVDEQ